MTTTVFYDTSGEPLCTVQDFITIEDFERTAEIIKIVKARGVLPIGERWLDHAFEHNIRKVDRYFRDAQTPQDRQQFMAMMKTQAQGYQEGAHALEWAARRLKDTYHDSHGANVTHKAALSMARAAQELIGEED